MLLVGISSVQVSIKVWEKVVEQDAGLDTSEMFWGMIGVHHLREQGGQLWLYPARPQAQRHLWEAVDGTCSNCGNVIV